MVKHENWSVDRKNLKFQYSSLICSKMDYDVILYDSVKKLEIQNTIIRLITGVLYTSLLQSIHVEANVLLLSLRRIFLCLKL